MDSKYRDVRWIDAWRALAELGTLLDGRAHSWGASQVRGKRMPAGRKAAAAINGPRLARSAA
ncbi:MAG TPA: hypothetical protein VN725_07435 [Rhodanobacteraceae bacterium]|nr:hypothetical protein [Rhodanobacteraceae bacterium]